MQGVGRARHVEGVDAQGGLGQLLPGTGLVGEDEHAVGAVEQRALLGHQVEAVAYRVDQQDVGDGQRGQRAGPVVFDVQDDGSPRRRCPRRG